MFKNRKLEVTMVKNDDEPIKTRPREPFITQDELVTGVIVIIGGYMLADTLRRCIIHTVAVKVTT